GCEPHDRGIKQDNAKAVISRGSDRRQKRQQQDRGQNPGRYAGSPPYFPQPEDRHACEEGEDRTRSTAPHALPSPAQVETSLAVQRKRKPEGAERDDRREEPPSELRRDRAVKHIDQQLPEKRPGSHHEREDKLGSCRPAWRYREQRQRRGERADDRPGRQ